jgi:excinuclease ABC subunit B
VRYLHSEIETLERSDIIRDLRLGEFDVLVGINLLREGLDLPEVALVAILDADREGFLRSTRSLIQIAGRAARNAEGKIILYADIITDSIRKTIEESTRRRRKQLEHNKVHGITPVTIQRPIQDRLFSPVEEDEPAAAGMVMEKSAAYSSKSPAKSLTEEKDLELTIRKLENDMRDAARKLEFEKAAKLRDRIEELRRMLGH